MKETVILFSTPGYVMYYQLSGVGYEKNCPVNYSNKQSKQQNQVVGTCYSVYHNPYIEISLCNFTHISLFRLKLSLASCSSFRFFFLFIAIAMPGQSGHCPGWPNCLPWLTPKNSCRNHKEICHNLARRTLSHLASSGTRLASPCSSLYKKNLNIVLLPLSFTLIKIQG